MVELSWFGSPKFERNVSAIGELAIGPNDGFSSLPNINEFEFLTLKKPIEIAIEKYGLSQDTRVVWILIITRVELMDGRIYDANLSYERIESFVQQLKFGQEPSLKDFEIKKASLREFIDRLNSQHK